MSVRIAPSILAADFAALGDAVAAVEAGGADLIHVDVMDGHFVPNITMGPAAVRALHRVAHVPLDVHLMIADPDRYLEAFADAGASLISVHAEAVAHLHRTVTFVRSLGIRAGVALNPSTPLVAIEEIAAELDVLLVMSVNPGFAGQAFIPRSESKVREARHLLRRTGSAALVEIDGGIDETNIARVVAAGADIIVAGAAIFNAADPAAATRALKTASQQALSAAVEVRS